MKGCGCFITEVKKKNKKKRRWAGFGHWQFFASPCLIPMIIDLFKVGVHYSSCTRIGANMVKLKGQVIISIPPYRNEYSKAITKLFL